MFEFGDLLFALGNVAFESLEGCDELPSLLLRLSLSRAIERACGSQGRDLLVYLDEGRLQLLCLLLTSLHLCIQLFEVLEDLGLFGFEFIH